MIGRLEERSKIKSEKEREEERNERVDHRLRRPPPAMRIHVGRKEKERVKSRLDDERRSGGGCGWQCREVE